jgi:hypothetical protein
MSRAPKVGVFVLETLTTGMYTNPLDTIREYVQNAADSIRQAEENGLLKYGQGRVEIEIDPKGRKLVIRDNGVGVDQDQVVSSLVDIGMSNKRVDTDAGFRGIGRLAGIAYCDTLSFRTTAKGNSDIATVRIDCNSIRQAISPSLRKAEELSNVVESCSGLDFESCGKDNHFFEVIMEGVDTRAAEFLDWHVLEKYLSQVAPVEYDSLHFLFAPKINEWIRKHQLAVPTITLIISAPGGKRQVFKPYKGNYKTKVGNYRVEIQDIVFFPEEPGQDCPFWLWYGKNELLGMVDDETSAGLRFRKNNIALGGPERVAELFPGGEGRLNSWFVGEIHVRSHSIIPNARRDGFEHSESWVALKDKLSPIIADMCRACHAASSAENRPTVKVIASAKSTLSDAKEALETGFGSKGEKSNLLAKLQREEERATQALQGREGLPEAESISTLVNELRSTRQTLESNGDYTVRGFRSDLSRKERTVLQEALRVIEETLSSDSCTKHSKCYKALKTALLNHFGPREGGQES